MTDRTLMIEEIARKLDVLPPENLAELQQFIDYLQYKSTLLTKPRAETATSHSHPAFGLWADRTDIDSSVDYAQRLRKAIENRRDGQPIN